MLVTERRPAQGLLNCRPGPDLHGALLPLPIRKVLPLVLLGCLLEARGLGSVEGTGGVCVFMRPTGLCGLCPCPAGRLKSH